LLIDTVTLSLGEVRTAVGADSRAVLVAQGLDGHRQGDHLSKKVIQADHGSAKQAGLEVLSEAETTLGKPSHPFRICGFVTLRRFQHEPEIVAKRVRIALGTPAALETHTTDDVSLEQHILSHATGLEVESEGLLDLAELVAGAGFASAPPIGIHLEVEGLALVAKALDQELEFRHGAAYRNPRGARETVR
jgi:hypothetical protein